MIRAYLVGLLFDFGSSSFAACQHFHEGAVFPIKSRKNEVVLEIVTPLKQL